MQIFLHFSPTARSQSPPDLPSILNRTESSSAMFDTSLQMDGFRDKSGGFRGLGKKKGKGPLFFLIFTLKRVFLNRGLRVAFEVDFLRFLRKYKILIAKIDQLYGR